MGGLWLKLLLAFLGILQIVNALPSQPLFERATEAASEATVESASEQAQDTTTKNKSGGCTSPAVRREWYVTHTCITEIGDKNLSTMSQAYPFDGSEKGVH